MHQGAFDRVDESNAIRGAVRARTRNTKRKPISHRRTARLSPRLAVRQSGKTLRSERAEFSATTPRAIVGGLLLHDVDAARQPGDIDVLSLNVNDSGKIRLAYVTCRVEFDQVRASRFRDVVHEARNKRAQRNTIDDAI